MPMQFFRLRVFIRLESGKCFEELPPPIDAENLQEGIVQARSIVESICTEYTKHTHEKVYLRAQLFQPAWESMFEGDESTEPVHFEETLLV